MAERKGLKIMKKCECYHAKFLSSSEYPFSPKVIAYCYGTKECEECSCGGDVSKCDFYPAKRKESKKMNFAEVWVEAQATDKWYINKDNEIVYQKDVGLVEADDFSVPVEIDSFDFGIESIMRAEWEEMKIPVLSKDEAEKKFNIKII